MRSGTRTAGWRGRARVEWEELVVGVLAEAWRWRVEVALLGAVVALDRVLAGALGEFAAAGVVVALVASAAGVGRTRRVLWRLLRRASVRRGWERAVCDTGLSDGPLLVPRVLGVRPVAAGDVLRVRVRRGQSGPLLDTRRDELAACLRVREVRLEQERGDAAVARVTLVRRDPFEDAAPLPWP